MAEKKNLPEIRFKGFSGEWEKRKLKDVSTYSNGGSFENDTQEKGRYELITLKSVDMDGNLVHSERYVDTEVPTLTKGTLVMILSEQSPGLLGMTAQIPIDNLYILNQRVAELRPSQNIDSYFLSMAINKNQQYFSRRGAGTKVQNISKPNVENYEFSCPLIQEQSQIGTYFKHLDHLITLNQSKYDKLVNVKKAMLEKMFPKKGDDVPEIRFKGFSGAWKERKVCELFKVTRGNVLAATETSEKQTENMLYPVYSSQTKNDGLMGYYKEYLFVNAITWTTDGANAGTVNYRSGKFYSTNVNGVLLSNEGYANKAIAEALNKVAWKHVSHVGNPKLMNNVMSEIVIYIPSSIEELIKISLILDNLDHLLTLQQQELEKLKNIKKACLEKMFV